MNDARDAVTTSSSATTVSGVYRFVLPPSQLPASTQPPGTEDPEQRGAPDGDLQRPKSPEPKVSLSAAGSWYSTYISLLFQTLTLLVSAFLLT